MTCVARPARWGVLAALISCAVLIGCTAGPALASQPSESILAPSPTVSGSTVHWSSTGLEGSYEIAISRDARGTDDRETEYLSVASTPAPEQSYTVDVPAGETLYVGISADDGVTWSAAEAAVRGRPTPLVGSDVSETEATEARAKEADEQAPSAATGTANAQAKQAKKEKKKSSKGTPTPPTPPRTIIGTDDGSGWGPEAAATILEGGIAWSREEIGTDSIPASLHDGFKVLAIVANTSDRTPLSQVNASQWGAEVVTQLKENPGVAIAEAGNEMYLKGGVAEPVQYGRMYLAAVNAMKAAKITTPLLFNMIGDYPHGSWSSPTGWSRDSSGGGWLRDAVNAVPGLAAAILANGVAIHPYGALGENKNDDYGVNAPAAEESVSRAVLGAIPKFYVTEFGYDLASCGRDLGACSPAEQASEMQAAYEVFLADPNIAGVWWYQSHDDGTGQFGFLKDNNRPRPSFKTLSKIAQGEIQ
jgi:hypothetical protein